MVGILADFENDSLLEWVLVGSHWEARGNWSEDRLGGAQVASLEIAELGAR